MAGDIEAANQTLRDDERFNTGPSPTQPSYSSGRLSNEPEEIRDGLPRLTKVSSISYADSPLFSKEPSYRRVAVPSLVEAQHPYYAAKAPEAQLLAGGGEIGLDSKHPYADKLSRDFTSRYQLFQILWTNFLRWCVSAVLLAFLVVTMYLYQEKGTTTTGNKHAFNVIITALQLLLGLNFFSALSSLARLLRWRVLAEKEHSVEEVDMILNCDQMSTLVKLTYYHIKNVFKEITSRTGVVSKYENSALYRRLHRSLRYVPAKKRLLANEGNIPRQRIKIRSTLFSLSKISIWLVISIGAQILIALIGLNYSWDAGGVLENPPIQSTFAPDLTHFFPLDGPDGRAPPSFAGEEFAAHELGDIGTFFNLVDVSDPEDPETKILPEAYYFVSQDGAVEGGYWMYRYFNYDADSFYAYTYATATERTVKVTWDNCEQFEVTNQTTGSSTVISFINNDGDSVTIGVDLVGTGDNGKNGTTTYIFPGTSYSQCSNGDPRCATVQAFQEGFVQGDDTAPAFLFQCDISVSTVQSSDPSQTILEGQQLQDEQAFLAAASSAFSGVGTTQDHYLSDNDATNYQFQLFLEDSYWSLKDASRDYVGYRMAEYAIASLAAMADFNPKDEVIGTFPATGTYLEVEWQHLEILLPIIAGVHFVFFVAAVFAASPYVIRDNSNLATALFLRPIVHWIPQGEGGYLTGKEIAAMWKDHVGLERSGLVYGAVATGQERHQKWRLSLASPSEGVNPRKLSGVRHLDGIYA